MISKRTVTLLVSLIHYRNLLIGSLFTSSITFIAGLSFFWTPKTPHGIDISNRLKPPSWEFWLGTDHFGRDVASMIMVGAQNSLIVGFSAVSIGLFVGATLGLWASAQRGWIEEIVMRLSDFTFAFPAILLAIMITAILEAGMLSSILSIAIFNISVFARVTRGSANVVWARDFVLASRCAGKGNIRITVEHIVPNIASILIVQATIFFAIAILAEAGLSYLGLGIQPPQPSLGRMLNEAQTFLYMSPYVALFPGLAISLAVLGFNLLGDGLRDALDPRLLPTQIKGR